MSRLPLGADPAGLALREHINARHKTLFDAASLPLTSVGGTANAVTATLDPALDGDGLVEGMQFGITWGAANTGGVTLAINGGTAVSVLDIEGDALLPGALGAGLRSRLEVVGSNLRVVSPLLLDGASAAEFYYTFTASGTWTKPADLADNRMVFVELWAGGGGGGSATSRGGGGGGGFMRGWLRAADLGATVTVTVGTGGTAGNAGGNSSFGAFLTAYGGGAGVSSGKGGGGGGSSENGATDGGADQPILGGYYGGGDGEYNDGVNIIRAQDASGDYGGGGGGAGLLQSSANGKGGRAIYGGGGGGGDVSGSGSAGGVSLLGGNGGAEGVAGQAPGGGGGRGAAGARGEIRIWIP